LLVQELQRWNIQVACLQEVRWLDSGEVSIGDTTFIRSGRNDGKHQEGVALAVQRKLMSVCVSWTPINERLLCARFRHTGKFLSLIVAYALTENEDTPIKEQFYVQLEVAIVQCGKNDLKMILGDWHRLVAGKDC